MPHQFVENGQPVPTYPLIPEHRAFLSRVADRLDGDDLCRLAEFFLAALHPEEHTEETTPEDTAAVRAAAEDFVRDCLSV